ncbi:exo-beta-1,4-galactosidase [Pedobacter sp.]|uniref:exo-beta-1,4-galactosidase n=1 Tax=Pedobacter sp. TaxID=1411316 RepID=UPI003D7F4480
MNFKSLGIHILLIFIVLINFNANAQTINLKGTWQFKTDQTNSGIKEKWYLKKFSEKVQLPGSMAGNLKGDDITLKTKWTGSIYDSSFYFNPHLAKYRKADNIKIPFWLTPAKHYVGAAWYKREVNVPQNWNGKKIKLYLERAHIETTVWVDGKPAGKQVSLVAPHEYDLTNVLSPGQHTIAIRVDNDTKVMNVGPDSHSITDHTQGNWNGIIGKMELQASALVYLTDVQIYPNIHQKSATVKLKFQNDSKKDFNGTVSLAAKSFNSKTPHEIPSFATKINIASNKNMELSMQVSLGEAMQLWDEFNPALYQLTAAIQEKGKVIAEKETTFGMREFAIKGSQFLINGRPVFLRGTVNNCEFPLTGYPATSVEEWQKIYAIAKAHGLNHMRFHSWCPPEAAFKAADLMGFYIQPEGPSWPNHGVSIGRGFAVDSILYNETNLMAKYYGNYASYALLAAGNEPAGDQVRYLNTFIDYWKKKDQRRVYTGMSVGGSWPIVPNAEFQVRGGVRGLDWNKRPESLSDFSEAINKFTVPFVAHEMGQWCVFPNFNEIKDYKGIYRAKNLELFEEDLNDQGMGEQVKDFLMTSGKLQALCYKNEIEKVFRTPNYAGFQLLGLQDFPGQGTALVGVLNAFWKEKGYITAQEFSRFCNTTVPLAGFPKFVFTNNEILNVKINLAHFGPTPLTNKTFHWEITDGLTVVTKGNIETKYIDYGTGIPIGDLSFPLSGIAKASKLKLTVAIEGTTFINDWDFWVYPAEANVAKTTVYYTTEFDEKAKSVLAAGGKVFFNAAGKVIKGKEVAMSFTPVFWNTSWFKMRPPHVTGMLIAAKSPAFNQFPTDFYSDLQWWEIANKSQVMILEDFPKGFKPLVQPIDTWFLNRRLGLIFEAKVGKGKLIVSSADLKPETDQTKPAARQLFNSLISYMNTDDFDPKNEVSFELIKDILTSPSKYQFDTYTKDSPDELKPNSNQNNPKIKKN